MASDVKKKFANRLKVVLAGRPLLNLGDQGGPSKSYLYRMIKGTANPSLEQIEAVLLAYGSSLGEFFEPWKEDVRVARQKLAVEARTRLERVLNSEVDFISVVELLRILDPGDSGDQGASRISGRRR